MLSLSGKTVSWKKASKTNLLIAGRLAISSEDSALNANNFHKQYITYSNTDKIFVMNALSSCKS